MRRSGLSTAQSQDHRPRGDNDRALDLRSSHRTGRRLKIGLINNMPDAALVMTERQFGRLVSAHADLHLFFLPEIERGETAQNRLRTHYQHVDALGSTQLDGVIVTGAEPRTADLREEAYWPSFCRLVDWAETHVPSSLWSCLAAHAAVLHLDGVRRRRLDRKCSGVFKQVRVGADPLLRTVPERSWVPHSRQNTLDEGDLAAAGYQLISRAEGAGVDAFVRRGSSTLVFLQGHPEYTADTLGLEYQRDFLRFARGASATPPCLPVGYFDPETERRLAELASERNASAVSAEMSRVAMAGLPEARWRTSAEAFYADWLASLSVAVAAARSRLA